MAISEAMEARAVMGLMAVVAPGAAMEARAAMAISVEMEARAGSSGT